MPCSAGPGRKASGRSTSKAWSRAPSRTATAVPGTDLHTHVAVANKVQTLDGRWLSIDGRVLFKANVAASETYNTALEQHLRDTLGVRFAERPGTDPMKRPIREIVGVDRGLTSAGRPAAPRSTSAAVSWPCNSKRIMVGRRRRLKRCIWRSRRRWRPATPSTNHDPDRATRRRAERSGNGAWRTGRGRGDGADGAHPGRRNGHGRQRPLGRTHGRSHPGRDGGEPLDLADVACRAEAQRQVRTADVPVERASVMVDLLVDEVLDRRCVALVGPADGIEDPEILRRADGSSVYRGRGRPIHVATDPRCRAAARCSRGTPRRDEVVDESAVDLALLEMAASGTALDAGQASLVRQMCTSGARLQLAIAPAGAGKTSAMQALTLAWTQDGGQVLGLAPSAAAAAVLGEQTGIRPGHPRQAHLVTTAW